MGLIAAALERRGIVTVVFSCLEPVTERVRAPRWLALPFPLGHPLGTPGDPDLQRALLREALDLATAPGPPPVRRDRREEYASD